MVFRFHARLFIQVCVSIAMITFVLSPVRGEVVRTQRSSTPSVSEDLSDEKLAKIGLVESPYRACQGLTMVDAELFKKNEAEWRRVRTSSQQVKPLEMVPSTGVFRKFDGSSAGSFAAKPGTLNTEEFLKRVGHRAVSDLKSGIDQFRDLKGCIESQSKSVLCELLEANFRIGIQESASELRAALGQIAISQPTDAARALVSGDVSGFLNPSLSLTKAGVFGASKHKSLTPAELSNAKLELETVLKTAKSDFEKMVNQRIESQGLQGMAAETERVRMTSAQAKTSAVYYRFEEHRAKKMAEYYRVLSQAPQLAYTTDAKIQGPELVSVLDQMLADAEKQLEKTERELKTNPMSFASYTGVIERILAEEAKSNSGTPKHCGLATGLFNESLAIKSGHELQVMGALITAPLMIGATGPRLASLLTGGRVALSAVAAGRLAVATGIGGGLLSSAYDFKSGSDAKLAASTGVRTAETARSEIAAGASAPIMAATNLVGGKVLVGAAAGAVGRRLALRNVTKLPPVIAQTRGTGLDGKVLDPARLKSSAILAKVGDAKKPLQNLEDGIYVYGIDSRGNVAVLPRNLDPGGALKEDSTYVGSHLGIQALLKQTTGRDPEFVSVGEFVQRNGRTFMAGNGAGTFKSGSENLEYGLAKLQEKGLPIDGRTQIRDYSKQAFEDPHDVANVQVPIELKVSRDPVLRNGHAEAAKVMREIDSLGIPDKDGFFERALGIEGVDGTTAYHAASLYGRWMHPQEGTMYAYDAIRDRIGPDQMEAALKLIRRMANEASKK